MTKRVMTARIDVPLNLASSTPLNRQVYDRIRTAILTGQCAPGSRLPSTRMLASQLGVSRNTVSLAYAQLLAEGYILGRVGHGTRVAAILPEGLLHIQPGTGHDRAAISAIGDAHLSQRGRLLAHIPYPLSPRPAAESTDLPAFRSGQPDVTGFPFDLWAKLLARHARETLPAVAGYQQPGTLAGYRPLREAIAAHVAVTRGVRCTADQVIIVAGSQGGLDLAARLLLDPGDRAWIEDPGYPGARGALLAAGAQLVQVPVDGDGLMVEVGMARAPDARLAVVTPSHQFPLGTTLSLPRRLRLLAWAREVGAWIVEDDYDSEYRFAGRPIEALHGLDVADRVLYLGTFSKVLFPSLRLGYLIVPPALAGDVAAARRFVDGYLPLLDQIALADFLREGHFARHVRRMRMRYAARRAALTAAVRDELAGVLELAPQEAGLHVVGWLPAGVDDRLVAERAAEHGVGVLPISAFAMEPLPRGGILLGYAALDEHAIREAVRHLATVLHAMSVTKRMGQAHR